MSPGQYKRGIMILVLEELFHVSMGAIEIRVYSGTVLHLGVNFCSMYVFLQDNSSKSEQVTLHVNSTCGKYCNYC